MAPIFAVTLFVSAFLMFLVEPMVGKLMLPILGGAPMVWNTCVVFFQLLLLGGYAYAHAAVSWLGPRRQAVVYAGLLAIPFVTLPLMLRADAGPVASVNPVGWLLRALASSVGLPFFVLSASSSILQQLFAAPGHPTARDPYFLYAASNLGSLLALVSYPLFVEPRIPLLAQGRLWAAGYAGFVVLAWVCVGVAWGPARSSQEPSLTRAADADPASDAPPSWLRRARWVALAFVPSSLMLAVTAYLLTDIAAVPLLWILPLALYLLTFALAFGSDTGRWHIVTDRAVPLLVLPVAMFMIAQSASSLLWFIIPLHLLAFAMVALQCHSQLVEDRPSARHLTEFYFWIALGGLLGGLFNTLVAPAIFTSIAEYPLVLVLACLLRPGVRWPARFGTFSVMDVVAPLGLGEVTAGLLVVFNRLDLNQRLLIAGLALPALACFSQSRRPLRFALSVGMMLLAGSWVGTGSGYGHVLHAERTFFGVYRVSLDPSGRYHELYHGTTLHGMQAVDPRRQNEPLSYYHRNGPFGRARARLSQMSASPEVAVVGLGVGSLGAYAAPGQHWTFYELDPAVERLARTVDYFTYLRDCGNRCRVVLGDARLSLVRARPHAYGLIVLDAFSSDAIPIHLMTREALALYVTRLAPQGILAFHVSNRHLRLAPVLVRLALELRLTAVERAERVTEIESADGKTSSDWVFMAQEPGDFASLAGDEGWVRPAASPSTPLWSDDFSNILGVLNLRGR
jgi:spermidine synthase